MFSGAVLGRALEVGEQPYWLLLSVLHELPVCGLPTMVGLPSADDPAGWGNQCFW